MSSCHYTFEGNGHMGKLKYQVKLGKIGTEYTHFGAENVQGDKMFVL